MKKMLCFLLLSFLLVPSLFGGGIYEHEKVMLADGCVRPLPFGKVIFQDSFAKEGVWNPEKTHSFQKLLKIEFGKEFQGSPCLYVTKEDLSETDTAWNVSTFPIPLPAEREKSGEFAMTFELCTDVRLNGPDGEGAMWQNAVNWLDADGNPCGRQPFTYLVAPGQFSEVAISGHVPEEAVSVVLQFGFDRPNIDEGKFAAVRNVAFSLLDPQNACSANGSFVSGIFAGGAISWEADMPEGTSVQFQVSTAQTLDFSQPSVASSETWSPFVGPDGTTGTFFTKPFSVTAPFVRYRAVLVPDGQHFPTLKSVRVGDVTDSGWTLRGDAFPPRVRVVSETPTQNRQSDLVLSITDDSPINWPSLKITVDGVEQTSSFTFVEDGTDSRFKSARLALKAAVPWADGLHTVDVSISDFYGNPVEAKKCFFIGETPQTPKVTVRDDGMTLIDGQPFFPIGIYGVMKREFNDFNIDKAFADLKEAGFNFAHSYSIPREDEFLAAAEKYGFKLWTVARFPDERFINIERHSPAILAWYLGDDTSANTTPSELFDRDDAVKAVDPTRVTTQADPVHYQSKISNYHDYVNGTDTFLPEIYPVHHDTPEVSRQCVAQTICDMKKIQDDIRQAGAPQKSIWPIIQYFQGWGWERFPTFDELNAMSFASIVYGAHGITWYTYGGTVEPKLKKFNYGVTTSPERWQNISTVATRIRELSPVLVERTGTQPAAPEILSGPKKDVLENDSISCLLKVHEGFAYLLCVNSTPETIQARFTLSGVASDAEVMFEDRNVSLKDGQLTDEFQGFGVHIYRLRLKD